MWVGQNMFEMWNDLISGGGGDDDGVGVWASVFSLSLSHFDKCA